MMKRRKTASWHRKMTLEVLDGSVEIVKTTKLIIKRNSKVFTVPGTEEEGNEAVGSLSDGMIRSKSNGSSRNIKMSLDPKKKPGSVMKMPIRRLVKSRSIGVVQSK